MNIDERFYPEIAAGGFCRDDGTLQFYLRVNALIKPTMRVVDLGAGRGAQALIRTGLAREMIILKGKAADVIGIDVDPAVLENPFVDRAVVYAGDSLPLDDSSVDMVVSDYTFEHVSDPASFSSEITRVLKPGGWLCGRTPNALSAVALAGSIVPNGMHSGLLRYIQPARLEKDVFPAFYKLNKRRALRKFFPSATWKDASYTWSPNPGYHFNRVALYKLMQVYQYLKTPLFGGEVLLIFMQKRAAQPPLL